MLLLHQRCALSLKGQLSYSQLHTQSNEPYYPFGNIALPEAGEGAQIKINYDWGTQMLMVTGSCEFRFATLIDDIIEKEKNEYAS